MRNTDLTAKFRWVKEQKKTSADRRIHLDRREAHTRNDWLECEQQVQQVSGCFATGTPRCSSHVTKAEWHVITACSDFSWPVLCSKTFSTWKLLTALNQVRQTNYMGKKKKSANQNPRKHHGLSKARARHWTFTAYEICSKSQCVTPTILLG